jgi:hypothetical protein
VDLLSPLSSRQGADESFAAVETVPTATLPIKLRRLTNNVYPARVSPYHCGIHDASMAAILADPT